MVLVDPNHILTDLQSKEKLSSILDLLKSVLATSNINDFRYSFFIMADTESDGPKQHAVESAGI